jgi:hypothetical protein
MSQSKSNISEYKLGAGNTVSNREISEFKASLDGTKGAPFRTKKMSLERVGLNSSSQLQKFHKLPMSSQKKLPPGLHVQEVSSHKPYMSG